MSKNDPSSIDEVVTIVRPILKPAVKDAVSKTDARNVLIGLLTESAALAKAIVAAEKLTNADLAHMWGQSLSEALEAEPVAKKH